jgi:hypothetical protein
MFVNNGSYVLVSKNYLQGMAMTKKALASSISSMMIAKTNLKLTGLSVVGCVAKMRSAQFDIENADC